MFKRIYIEISNICNVQCSFCPIVESDKRAMSLTEFEAILKQVVPLTEIVCLHLLGEPLAHPKFKEIIAICDTYNTEIEITTNGLLIRRYTETLLESKSIRQVNFSLQSFRDNFPEKDIQPYLAPIFDFVKLANESRPLMYHNFRLWNLLHADSDNEEVLQKIETAFDISVKRTVEVGGFKSKKIWNNLYLHFDTRFEWPSLELPFQGTKGRCNGVLQHIAIHANGTVVPCCLDEKSIINLGNVNETSLEEILKSERFLKMKKGFENGVLVEELCQKCSFINRFKK